MKKINYNVVPNELEFMFNLSLGKVESVPENIDWEYFDKLVEKSRIQPLLANSIPSVNGWSEYQSLTAIGSKSMYYTLNNMKQITALGSVFDAFSKEGIRVMSVKGPLFALQLYKNPGLRYSKDLDIWVDPEKVDEGCQILENLGWTLEPGYEIINSPKRKKTWMQIEQHYGYWKDGVMIEIHWYMHPWKKDDFERLWKNHEEKMIAGVKVPVFDFYDDMGFQIYHGARHIFWRLRWLIDAYYILTRPDIDMKKLYQKMKDEGTEVVLLETILLLNRTKSMRLPDIHTKDFCISCDESGITIKYKDYMQDKIDWAMDLVELAEKAMVETELSDELNAAYKLIWPWDGKIRTFRERAIDAFAPRLPEWNQWDLPDSLYFLYYVMRPIFWVKRKLVKGEE